jgi:hypothetical protein
VRDRGAFDVVQAELPKYRCHKEVRALQIARIDMPVDPAAGPTMIHFIDPRFAPVAAEPFMFARYIPVFGDYYVVYHDGYKSISPREEFEAGYSLIA